VEYVLRFYREWVKQDDLVTFEVKLHETDLSIRAKSDLSKPALSLVRRVRGDIEIYAEKHPGFIEALAPWPEDPAAPAVVQDMIAASERYGVGPMAAVAGAVAEVVGRGLLAQTDEVIVENGGDVFLKMNRPALLMLYSGEASPFGGKLLIRIDAPGKARGVCTSSATIGHSLSFGATDAVVAVAESAALADAAATAIGNRVRTPADVAEALEAEKDRALLLGTVVTIGNTLGAFGDIEFEQV
jgi:hypothetical protein